jgi:hypothetical protein
VSDSSFGARRALSTPSAQIAAPALIFTSQSPAARRLTSTTVFAGQEGAAPAGAPP